MQLPLAVSLFAMALMKDEVQGMLEVLFLDRELIGTSGVVLT